MKRLFLLVSFFLLLSVNASTLRGGVSEEYIPDGFFGSWGVISKLKSSNNLKMFNYQSKDIWTLSGHGNLLVLQNLESGARSEFWIDEKTNDCKTLKFKREKKVDQLDATKVLYKEIVQFKLNGNNFSGTDKFIVEKYNKNNQLIKKDEALYNVEGVKISGTTPK